MSEEIEAARYDVPAIRQSCHRALWDVSFVGGELAGLVTDLEGYVRDLAPVVERLMSRLRDDVALTARVSLGHADEVLAEAAPRADLAARAYDLGVVVRSLLTLVEMADRWSTPQPAEPVGD